jgi:hypothetical protein
VKTIFRGVVVAAFLGLMSLRPSVAQQQVTLVEGGDLISATNPLSVTCISGCVAGGGTVTANQGTPNAGGASAWPETLVQGGALVSTTNGIFVQPGTGATWGLAAGTNIIGKFGIDQTTPGTTNAVQAGSFTDRNTSTPTVQNAAYASGNCVGGFNSVTFQGTGPINFLNDVRVMSQGGGTETLTAYVFDQNPSGSTCTDKSTFTLATADTAKLLLAPFALTLAALTGAPQSFASNPNLARIPKSGTTTLYYALVAGGTFTPASTTDLIVGFQVVQQHQ